MDETTLMCSICPGEPQFSDVSHLLTHAASKAHLANHFKLKLRTDDSNSIELLKQYDDWFEANGFAKQLAARMAKKEIRKKRTSDGELSSNAAKRTRSQAPKVDSEESSTPATTVASVPDYLDPRLADSHDDNHQHVNTILTPTTPNRLIVANGDAKSRTGPILRSMRSLTGTKSNVLQPMDASGLGDENRSLALPITPAHRKNKPIPLDRTWNIGRDTPDPFIDSGDQTQSSGDSEIDKARAEEIARLKGVLWPGMDIFDSATLQMRRRRNQKKDGAALQMMIQSSSLVEPNEMVFSPDGTLLTERVITGNVEEYTPLKGETPIPKRGLTRLRAPRLTKADPNVPRAADRKRQKIDNDRKNIEEESVKEEQTPPHRAHHAVDRTQSYVGGDEEFGLTVNAFGKRPKGGFNIFVDEQQGKEESKASYQEPGFTQFDSLTPTRLVLNGKTNTGIHVPKIGHASVDKENIEPILNPQGRIGSHNWPSPFAKHTDSNDIGYGLPYPSDLGDPYGSNFDKAGYRSNPLQAPLKHSFYDNQYEEPHVPIQNNWLSMEQAAPSDETIPEDDHMFSSYYLTTDTN
ncbi:uncharacterized protein N7479_010416 [Penicillium vulpinum]|uniref:uncharacterized protein n=1 Tax=Penicillium vulpinum TaxID=29845 RepID=UPI0025475DB3|nr:uncharacterized protein N7479_010416 [Penicillium vulpinum]KAJ5952003.1 hypothetical protein N7479_010416 [Penicillium vulpinum]